MLEAPSGMEDSDPLGLAIGTEPGDPTAFLLLSTAGRLSGPTSSLDRPSLLCGLLGLGLLGQSWRLCPWPLGGGYLLWAHSDVK